MIVLSLYGLRKNKFKRALAAVALLAAIVLLFSLMVRQQLPLDVVAEEEAAAYPGNSVGLDTAVNAAATIPDTLSADDALISGGELYQEESPDEEENSQNNNATSGEEALSADGASVSDGSFAGSNEDERYPGEPLRVLTDPPVENVAALSGPENYWAALLATLCE